MYPKLKPSEEEFDHLKETRYCLRFSKLQMDYQKKETFRNKLCFDYSLQKLSKEKMYGDMISFACAAYPSVYSKGNRICNYMYSSDKVKENRKRLFSQRYNKQKLQSEHRDPRRTKLFLSKKKNQQGGGIDSFWIFKKDPVKEQKKKPKGQVIGGQAEEEQDNQSESENRVKQSYFKLLTFAKMPLQLENSIVPRNTLSKYISSIFGETFCIWFINFYQFKPYMNFKEFEIFCEKFKNISLRESHLISFFLYDDNGDGFLCPRDLFSVFQRQLSLKIDEDILKVGEYVKNNIGKKVQINQEFKIENVCIRDDWLTVKDYEMYFQKVDEPYLKATNKKDTVFSKSFAVLDHRQKVRSKRKQMNEKKNFYEELYGEITKMKKNEAHIDAESDYKLNYSLLFEIFGKKSTKLFNFFMSNIFGIDKHF